LLNTAIVIFKVNDLDGGGLAILIKGEDVGSSYVDLAVCSELEMKLSLDETEKRGFWKPHRSEARDWGASLNIPQTQNTTLTSQPTLGPTFPASSGKPLK
jgi:hypothetical protein